MNIPVHRNTDSRRCGATTTVVGQSTVYVNNLLASVQDDPNTHGGGALNASVNDGTVYVNGKKLVLKGSTARPDALNPPRGAPHNNPASTGGSPNVFACGGGPGAGGGGYTYEGDVPDPSREDLYPDPAVQQNADGSPQPGDDDYIPDVASPPSDYPEGDVVEILESGPGYNIVRLRDGTVERRDGTFAWRNNNPGNIEDGPFARSQGALPDAQGSRFAVFPNYETGRRAKEALLWETSGYQGRTIDGALNRYAPPNENNTPAYIRSITNALGVPASTPMSSLTPAQRSTMLDTMERIEGYRSGTRRNI